MAAAAALGGSLAGNAALAAEKGTLVTLSASARTELANDEANLVFSAKETAKNLEEATRRVIERTNKGVAAVKAMKLPLILQTQNLSSYPVYGSAKKGEEGKIVSWVVTQTLSARVKEAGAAAQAAQKIGEHFAFQSVTFSVSRAAKDAAQDKLTEDAVKQLQKRVAVIAKGLGRSEKKAKFETMDFSQDYGYENAPRMRLMKASAVGAAQDSMPAVSFEPGVSELSLSVSAKVRIGE